MTTMRAVLLDTTGLDGAWSEQIASWELAHRLARSSIGARDWTLDAVATHRVWEQSGPLDDAQGAELASAIITAAEPDPADGISAATKRALDTLEVFARSATPRAFQALEGAACILTRLSASDRAPRDAIDVRTLVLPVLAARRFRVPVIACDVSVAAPTRAGVLDDVTRAATAAGACFRSIFTATEAAQAFWSATGAASVARLAPLASGARPLPGSGQQARRTTLIVMSDDAALGEEACTALAETVRDVCSATGWRCRTIVQRPERTRVETALERILASDPGRRVGPSISYHKVLETIEGAAVAIVGGAHDEAVASACGVPIVRMSDLAACADQAERVARVRTAARGDRRQPADDEADTATDVGRLEALDAAIAEVMRSGQLQMAAADEAAREDALHIPDRVTSDIVAAGAMPDDIPVARWSPLLAIPLRRRHRIDTSLSLIRRLQTAPATGLVEQAPTLALRSLIVAVGQEGSPIEVANAALVSQLASYEKLAQTYVRSIRDTDDLPSVRRAPEANALLWDDMNAFNLFLGDAANNMFRTTRRALAATPAIARIFETVVDRMRAGDTILARLNDVHGHVFDSDTEWMEDDAYAIYRDAGVIPAFKLQPRAPVSAEAYEAAVRACAARHPEQSMFQARLFEICRDRCDYDQAAVHMRNVSAALPNDPGPLVRLARMYCQARQPADARLVLADLRARGDADGAALTSLEDWIARLERHDQ
ncbi:MAG: tetratricopeptide repeat protein [Pseudomonadota bacterium]